MPPADMPAAPISLAADVLDDLDGRIDVPTYRRDRLVRSIVHIGVGGFHRAHQAVYLDDLLRAGETEWAITGAGVLPGDSAMAEALRAQDHLYALTTRDDDGDRVRVIGSIVDYRLGAPDPTALVDALAAPQTRLVTMTITEGGYPIDEGSLDYRPPAGATPPVFLALARALRQRHDAGVGGFTVLSCDNVMHNGAIAQAATLGAIGSLDSELEAWARTNVAFPNSMVDRITPVTTDADRETLASEYGLFDRWPVVSEPFIQWVIEDAFPYGRPPYEDAGAIITSDVAPYETLKLRLLNAGHSVIAYLASLEGLVHVSDVMADPVFARYLAAYLELEAAPSLPAVPGIDVPDYRALIVARFSNSRVADQVARIALDGSAKLPKFVIPSIEANIENGGRLRLGALALAGWCQYLLGDDGRGRSITVSADPGLAAARRFAQASVARPTAFLEHVDVLGPLLGRSAPFRDAFVAGLEAIRARGARAAIEQELGGTIEA